MSIRAPVELSRTVPELRCGREVTVRRAEAGDFRNVLLAIVSIPCRLIGHTGQKQAKGCSALARSSEPAPGPRGKETQMNDTPETGATPRPRREFTPIMQRLLDNPFLLLFIGVAIPSLLYTLWGVMEIVSIPMAD
jgi:hypothetical protein